ncbi:MAG TPA: ATP-binding protein [Gemmatimonadaceae bacterium]|nr:ATP-binding protein [Gemmatimonadaceae bacterium]
MLGEALDRVRRATGARTCTICLDGDCSTQPAARSFPLSAGSRRLGALTISTERALTSDQERELGLVATVLVPTVLASQQANAMAREMALRTQEVEAQRRFIERIIDSLPLGMHVIDREYRIQAWNRKRETGTQGIARDEAIGRTIFEVLNRQPQEMLRREFEDVFRTGRIGQYEMESVATGEPRHYRVSKIPMRIADDDVTHVITIGEDITEWKRAQERVAHAEKLAAVGQLAAGVMHEINNPLATIGACGESMSIELQQASAVPDTTRKELEEYLRIIDHEVHRCKRIIDDLLQFSRRGSAGKSAVDIHLVLEETLVLLNHHSRFKKVEVERDFTEPAPVVHGNQEQLIQVFIALLLNAADAMKERGKVRLRTAPGASSGVVAVEVADQGHGIPAGELSKIFEPFYTTKPPGRGTGLGLSICYGIVSEHGGRIEVESTVGQGSTFRVLLPAGEMA